MNRNPVRLMCLMALALMLVSAGCGGGDEGGEKSAEDFRVPDSLLASIEGYKITIDEYHPIRGGVIANKDILIQYPARQIARFIATNTFDYAYKAYGEVSRTIGRPSSNQIVLIGAKDLPEYQYLTKKEWWYYGVIQGDTLYFEPFDVLMKRYDMMSERSLAEIGITQKIAQMALIRLSRDKIPMWLRESIASYMAGEKAILMSQAIEFEKEYIGLKFSVEDIEKNLSLAENRVYTRLSMFIAYTMLENLMESHSLEEIVGFVRKLGEGFSLDQASTDVFGMDYGQLLEKVSLKEDFTHYLDEMPRVKREEGQK